MKIIRICLPVIAVVLFLSAPYAGSAESKYEVADIFAKMRAMSFDVKPADLHITRENHGQIYGVFMETGLNTAAYSVRCFKDGTISIYFTNGGGLIGIGEHEQARARGIELISFSENFKKRARKVTTRDLPSPGETFFYLLSFDGVYLLSVKTDDIEDENNELYPLYMKAQDVITEARKIEESKK